MRKHGVALQFASARLRDDDAVVAAAVANQVEALEFASLRLQGDPAIKERIQLSWSVEMHGDESKRRHNMEVLDTIAHFLTEYPDIGLQVHGRTADMPQGVAPKALADWFGKRPLE